MSERSDDNFDAAFASRATARGVLACAWGLALFASILFAGLRLCPAFSGWLILGLIAAGFALFTTARASVSAEAGGTWSCAPLLRPRMRAMYWAGYLLMFSGVVLTALVSVTRLGR